MGAWDTGSFDNDDAMDWVAYLQESDTLEPLETALDVEGDFVDSPDGAVVLAAAETLLAFVGQASAATPSQVAQWVSGHRYLDTRPLKGPALAALDLVISEDSELAELWDESDSGQKWRADVQRLRETLSAADLPAPVGTPPAPREAAPQPRPWWKFWA